MFSDEAAVRYLPGTKQQEDKVGNQLLVNIAKHSAAKEPHIPLRDLVYDVITLCFLHIALSSSCQLSKLIQVFRLHHVQINMMHFFLLYRAGLLPLMAFC